MQGRIFDIQRFSIHDGPGIRTTVFLKGCPLRCLWCHNPEGISPKPLLQFTAEKCIGCITCVPVCPEKALVQSRNAMGKPRVVLDRDACSPCGKCAAVCDTNALEMVGRDATVESVMEVVMRDRDYYAGSGGGITVSGGEPLFQPEFALALLTAAKRENIHTAVETSGFVEWHVLEKAKSVTDLFLFDYKETDPQLHQNFTGQPNAPIIENLRRLHAAGARIRLRCPMIPEYNARREHLDGIARIARELGRLEAVDVLPYHRLGRSKLNRLGLATRMPESVAPPSRETAESWRRHLKAAGAPVSGL